MKEQQDESEMISRKQQEEKEKNESRKRAWKGKDESLDGEIPFLLRYLKHE